MWNCFKLILQVKIVNTPIPAQYPSPGEYCHTHHKFDACCRRHHILGATFHTRRTLGDEYRTCHTRRHRRHKSVLMCFQNYYPKMHHKNFKPQKVKSVAHILLFLSLCHVSKR